MSKLSTPCIEHTGYTRTVGTPYGIVKLKGKQYLAHRWSYCEHRGIPIEDIQGKVVLHMCDNPKCVNPLHLVVGTQADNMYDMRNKGRAQRGVDRPHAKLKPADVLYAREVYRPRHPQYGLTPLAKKFGVSLPVLHNAITGKRWNYL